MFDGGAPIHHDQDGGRHSLGEYRFDPDTREEWVECLCGRTLDGVHRPGYEGMVCPTMPDRLLSIVKKPIPAGNEPGRKETL